MSANANRKHKKEDVMDWNKTLADYHRSGLSGSAYCRNKKIKPSGFFYYLAKERKAADQPAPKKNGHTNGHHKNGFIDLTATPMIEIETKGGAIIRLPQSIDASKLKEIVEALQ